MAEKNILTQQEYDNLIAELEALKAERKGIAEEIAIARGHGDLSENAEYDAALNNQAELEEKISRMQERANNAHIITDEELKEGKVNVGQVVLVKDLNTGIEQSFEIVGQDPDPFTPVPKITQSSAIGAGLHDKVAGDVAEILLPNGTMLKYKIPKVTRSSEEHSAE